MNILLLNQYYPPDVAPTGLYLRELAEALVARGHGVTVLCSSRSYADGRPTADGGPSRPGITVWRVAGSGFGRGSSLGRIVDAVTFSMAVFVRLALLRPAPDLVLALTSPPYVGLLARLVCGLRGSRHAHWVMDLYPDVMRAHGMLRARSLADRVLTGLTRLQLRGSVATVVLGPDMAARVAAYLPPASGTAGGLPLSVPLWATDMAAGEGNAAGATLRAREGWTPADFVLMYSGNMGLGHRFSEFLGAARELSGDAHVRWVFAGAGPRRAEVEQFARAHPAVPLALQAYVPAAQLREHLAAADVHLVSMEPAWQGCLVPSKLQNIFALGKPVIFVGAGENSIAQWIRESGGGWVVGIDDVAGLLRAVREAREPEERARRGAAARAYAAAHFDRAANCARICDALERGGA